MREKNFDEEYRDLLISTPRNMSGAVLGYDVPTRTNNGGYFIASQSPEDFFPKEGYEISNFSILDNDEIKEVYKALLEIMNPTKNEFSGIKGVNYDIKTNTMLVYTTEERRDEVEANMQAFADNGFNIEIKTADAFAFFEYFDINQNRIHNNYCKTAFFHELLKGKKVIMMDPKEEYKALCGTLGDEHIVLKREDKNE